MTTGTGYFNDGRSARRFRVRVDIDGADVRIAGEDGRVLARWPLADVRYADPAHHEAPVRLVAAGSDERLTLDGDGAWLLTRCPDLVPRRRVGGKSLRTWIVAGALAALSMTGVFLVLIPSAARWAVSMVPPAAEAALGVTTRDQFVGFFARLGAGVCVAPAAEKLLARTVDELAAVMESPFKIQVSVIRFPIANALALPGGQVVVLSGLLDKAENGDEIAGVLAHEIAHVVRRDPLHVAVKRAGAAALIGLVVGDVTGGFLLSGLASAAIEGGYSRDAERAADLLAVAAMNALGLTARPLADFLDARSKASPVEGVVPEFLSTHPSSERRADEIRAAAQGSRRAFSPYEWQTIRTMCR